MTNTTNPTTSPTMANYSDEGLTAVELREAARLVDMIGQDVVMTYPGGRTFEGRLDSVYVTDGLAVNVLGHDGTSFSFGPLYGAKVSAVVDLG